MQQIEPVFLGVDPTSGQKSFTYAVLDKDLRVVALDDGEMEDVISLVEEQTSSIVAINSPSTLNRGLVEKKLKKEMTAQHQIRGAQMRLCEYELRQHGISVSGTPSNMTSSPSWMQLGFRLYRKLEKLGFSKYPSPASNRQVLETHPHACYSLLAEVVPQPKPSIEGRLQRQLLLYEKGVRVRDSMDFFEEITRHKMMKGIWPVELLYLPAQLDALVAAYVAWLAFRRPEQVSFIGDEKEGQIVLPEKELKENY